MALAIDDQFGTERPPQCKPTAIRPILERTVMYQAMGSLNCVDSGRMYDYDSHIGQAYDTGTVVQGGRWKIVRVLDAI